jgi:hypothetical protein
MYKIKMQACKNLSEDIWVPVFFCGWMAIGEVAGAVVEWDHRPVWMPLDRLRFENDNKEKNHAAD